MKRIQVEQTAGLEYGEIPGHPFHNVCVTLQRRTSGQWCADIVETWGRNQGHLEEHGNRKVSAQAGRIDELVERATTRAEEAGIDGGLLVQAISLAESEVLDLTEEETPISIGLAQTSTDELLAELRRRIAAKKLASTQP